VLFVAAHWDMLSPSMRFGLVLSLVALFHVAAAVAAERFPALSTALHAVGTICLGAGIFLAGQNLHLQEHWPGGFMLWALGAWIAWVFLRDWPQAALAALLSPIWFGPQGGQPSWADAKEKRPACQIDEGECGALYLMFNAAADAADICLPVPPSGAQWHLAVDTFSEPPQDLFADSEAPLLNNQRTYHLAHVLA